MLRWATDGPPQFFNESSEPKKGRDVSPALMMRTRRLSSALSISDALSLSLDRHGAHQGQGVQEVCSEVSLRAWPRPRATSCRARRYADSEDAFFSDFSKAYAKLLELGVPEQNWGGKEPMLLLASHEYDE